MLTRTIRLVPGAIVFGLVPRMRLLWLPVDDSSAEAMADSVLQIRVRVCDVAYETHPVIPHSPCLEPVTWMDSA